MSKKDFDDSEYFYDEQDDWYYTDENQEFESEDQLDEDINTVTKINRLNDINILWEIKDVDVSHIFELSKLWVSHKLKNKNTIDLVSKNLVSLNLSKKNILKIKSLYIPISEVYNKNENKNINLTKDDFMPIDIENSIDVSKKVWEILDDKVSKSRKVNNTISNLKIKRENKKLSFYKNKNLLKTLYIFSLAIFLVLGYWFYTKNKIISTFDSLKSFNEFKVKESWVDDINKKIKSLKIDFLILNTLLKPINWLNYFFDNQKLSNLNYLVSWWLEITNFWVNFLKIYQWVSLLIEQKWPDWIKYTQLFKNIDPLLIETKESLDNSINIFSNIKDLENDELNQIFFSKIETLKKLRGYIDYFYDNKETIESILWDEKERKYMVVFQNNDEIRPTWGFMWSAMFVTLYKWKVLEMDKKDIYALEYLLKPYRLRIPAPEWINKLTQYFWLRDSNYYFDIWTSSNKIKEFLDKTPYKIDWILYVNQNLVKDFLSKYWEVNFPFIKETITSQNFSMITSSLVEAKVTKTSDVMSTPKQVLFDFVDFYIKDLKSKGDYFWYLKLFFDSIEKKDLIFYSFIKKDDDFIKKIWLRQETDYSKNIDFNYPIFTSISWNKSDRYIKRTFIKNIKQNPDCSFDINFWINQEHLFTYKEESSIKNFLYKSNILDKIDLDKTLEIQWKQKNIQFIRVLLPKNSIIKKKKSMDIYSIDNFGEVWFYLETPLFGSSKFDFEYKILNPECKPYNYLLVKQPWLYEYDMDFNKDNLEKQKYNNVKYDFEYNN